MRLSIESQRSKNHIPLYLERMPLQVKTHRTYWAAKIEIARGTEFRWATRCISRREWEKLELIQHKSSAIDLTHIGTKNCTRNRPALNDNPPHTNISIGEHHNSAQIEHYSFPSLLIGPKIAMAGRYTSPPFTFQCSVISQGWIEHKIKPYSERETGSLAMMRNDTENFISHIESKCWRWK